MMMIMGLKETGYEAVDCTHLYHDRDEELAVMNRRVLKRRVIF
jgi:hypothetical protein